MASNEDDELIAYCMKCKKKVKMQNPKAVQRKNGRWAIQGTCPYCGSTVSRFVTEEVAKKYL